MTLTVRETYNQQALQSTRQMLGAIAANSAHFKKKLPQAKVAVEIGIQTSEASKDVYRVAAMTFDNAKERNGRIELKVSVYKYEDLHKEFYGQFQRISDVAQSSALISVSSSREVNVPRLEVINNEVVRTMNDMKAPIRCPDAYTILTLMQETFPTGLPLPSETRSINRCRFRVMTLKEGGDIEILGSWVGFDRIGPWSSVHVEESKPYEEKYQTHRQQFEELVLVARGERLPSFIPTTAKGSSETVNFKVKVINSGDEGKRLKDNSRFEVISDH